MSALGISTLGMAQGSSASEDRREATNSTPSTVPSTNHTSGADENVVKVLQPLPECTQNQDGVVVIYDKHFAELAREYLIAGHLLSDALNEWSVKQSRHFDSEWKALETLHGASQKMGLSKSNAAVAKAEGVIHRMTPMASAEKKINALTPLQEKAFATFYAALANAVDASGKFYFPNDTDVYLVEVSLPSYQAAPFEITFIPSYKYVGSTTVKVLPLPTDDAVRITINFYKNTRWVWGESENPKPDRYPLFMLNRK
jgi:hypothetical protein